MLRSFLSISLIFFGACAIESGGTEAVGDNSVIGALERRDSCQTYEGSWEVKTYKGATSESEFICDGAPCEGGNWEGYLRVRCINNKLLGSVILGFSSLPAPGKETSAPLDISVTDTGIMFSYSNQRQCKVEYDMRQEERFLIGKFSSKNCKYKASYETDAEFAEGITGGVVLVKN